MPSSGVRQELCVSPGMFRRNGDILTAHRSSGILLHITSLPGPYGIGDLGPEAYAWIDTLARAGQTWWQTLPLAPPAEGASPYKASSAFAGNTALISPDLLFQNGLLQRDNLRPPRMPTETVSYSLAVPWKQRLLGITWERTSAGHGRLRDEFDQFCHTAKDWLDDFALFEILHRLRGDWATWPADLRKRKPDAMRYAQRELRDEVDRSRFGQFLFFRQLEQLREHAKRRDVRLLGDLPIFVSQESADVWAHQHLFQLDIHGRPKVVSGVPPDLFSRTGQLWGNPLYNWNAMRRDGYRWWIARLAMMQRQFDAVRIDHFRGFAAYWAVPAGARDARRGRWIKGPGIDLFNAVRASPGHVPLIAEDLGLITPDVDALRHQLGIPGMAVLQFAFGGDATNRYLPHNHTRNLVVYPGTHDNNPCVGWARCLTPKVRKAVECYLPGFARDPAWALIGAAWSSVACCAIAQLQDILRLGDQARMNTPSTSEHNWGWRYAPKPGDRQTFTRLRELTKQYARTVKQC